VPLVQQRLQQIFREVFDDGHLILSPTLSAATLPHWDSLAHMKLIMACEEEFGVQFTIEETVESNSVARLLDVLAAKGAAR
jgi:acyl carrier protein